MGMLASSGQPDSQYLQMWTQEYTAGMGKEIYRCSLKKYTGKSFHESAEYIFEKFGSILFAVGSEGSILLNPGRTYIINADDNGFILADDHRTADQISGITEIFRDTTRDLIKRNPKRIMYTLFSESGSGIELETRRTS